MSEIILVLFMNCRAERVCHMDYGIGIYSYSLMIVYYKIKRHIGFILFSRMFHIIVLCLYRQ